MFDFADQSTSAAGPIRPFWGSTFPARSPAWVRAMRDPADQTDGRGPVGSGSTLPSRQLSRCKKPSRWTWTMRCEKAEKERSRGEIVAEAVEPAVGAGRLSLSTELSSPLPGSLICNLPLYLSSPSQNLNLRSPSTWLCGVENDLRTWPPGGRVSVYLRSRKGACRTSAGRLFGPIGRLFRPGGHGHFGVALGTAGSCTRQACRSKERQRRASIRGFSALRPALRLCLRPSLHLWLHRPIEPKARNRRPQRGLRAWQFADISTQPPGRNIKRNRGSLIVLSILSASLALAACAIASALAPQRFAGSTAPIALGATAIASALATHRLLASALASQRSGLRRPRARRLA
jgi:hypothetical protein